MSTITLGRIALRIVAAMTCAASAMGQTNAAPMVAGRAVTSQPVTATQPAAAASRPTTRSGATQPAALRVDDAKFDFGKIWDSDKVEHTFEMVNTGDRPVTILDIQTTCGCTKSHEYEKEVPPGGTWKLPIEFVAKGNLPGKTSKSITVKTNDAGRPQVVFQLDGEITLRLDVKPTRAVMFGTVRRDATVRKTLTITNQGEEPVTLKNAKVDSERLKVSLREVEAGRKYELDVETVPPLTVANIGGKITVETGLKYMPELLIIAVGQVQQRVSLRPQLLTVPQPLGSEFRRQLVVKGEEGVAFHIKGMTVSNPKVQLQLETVREGTEYNVWVVMPAGFALPTAGEKITINTDDPEIPVLTALVRALTGRPNRGPLPVGMHPASQPAPGSARELAPTTRAAPPPLLARPMPQPSNAASTQPQ